MDANKRVSDLITISGRLAALLDKENKALRLHDARTVAGLLKEKETLCRAYEARIRGMDDKEEVAALTDVDEKVRERLMEMGRKVEGLMAENARLLKTEMEVGRRVLDSFAAAVKEARPGAGTYGANGSNVSAPEGTSAVTLDRSL